ncbi:acyloxyacyl hydrolase [Thiomonas bhubaneswarensis]|uniref:Lipid A deacylase n=1 Tax=Thiomonas bhubaneswarensis TaxID=339866 RepID=A0A0K6HSA4_9BURK|nr:acyloxyacyl hydrolase [Thiomonas bhubaneswarensis]CUA93643.1 Lipid A 3-O-deacylase (PagL) [Thiomonas bhubaneswarensis]
MSPSLHRRLIPSFAAILLTTACLAPAQAAEVSLLGGVDKGDNYRNVTLALQSAPVWRHDFAHSQLDLVLEASLGQVSSSLGPGARHLTHVGLTPFVRWWFAPQTAMEFGIGANLFSGTTLGAKEISTAYQFGDSIGLLHRFADTPWTVGARLTHYSNADIKRPNPGQDYLQLRVGYSF